MKRDNTLDFFRGFAAIWIIFVHTCFWSGELYLPFWLKSLSLIIDVPIFIFISGMSFNFSNSIIKSIKGIIKIWYKYLLFLIIYFLIIGIINLDSINTQEIIETIFFRFTDIEYLPVVDGSIWFVFMFIIVTLTCNTIIVIYNKYNKTLDNFKYILILVFILYGMSYFNYQILPITTREIMYSFIYLLGYYLYQYKKMSLKNYLTIISVIITTFLILLKISPTYSFLYIQDAKINAGVPYLFYSLISIVTVLFLKNKLNISKNNIFCFVGKNALTFYFAQGIGSSLIYYLYPYIKSLGISIKLLIMFSANLVITSLIVIILLQINKLIEYLKLKKIIIKE